MYPSERVRQVCRELFHARQYTVNDQGVDDEWGWFLRGEYVPDHHVVHLYVLPYPKLNVDVIKLYYRMLHDLDVRHAILVYRNAVTSSVHKLIESLDLHIELFSLQQVSFNLLKHELVPEHVRIGHAPRNTMQYPALKRTDPVARFLGFKHGDLIRITRKDGTLYYRFVR